MASTWVSPKSRKEFSKSGIVKGYLELDPLGCLRPALVSQVGAIVTAVTRGARGGVEIVAIWGGAWCWGTIGVAKIWARVTRPLWSVISARESSKEIAARMVGSSRSDEGLWTSTLPTFSFLLRRGQLAEVGTTIMTPKSSKVKGRGELLWYCPSS